MKTLSIIVTDMGFIAPSMLLAEQLSQPHLARLTDVLVFALDAPEGFLDRLGAEFTPSNIRLQAISAGDFAIAPDYLRYFEGHVPPSALARLAIAALIPADYDNIIYFDGDMQIVGDIAPLLTFQAPEGTIAAACENFVMREAADGTRPGWMDGYFAGLGLDHASQYFNSGLLLFRRSTWLRIAPAALDFFLTNPGVCRHHDQSALNATLKGDWLPLSPAYNYATFFLGMGGFDAVRPKILHFASAPKPWQSGESPWPPCHAQSYRRFLARHPVLADRLAVYDAAAAPGAAARLVRGAKTRVRALTKTADQTRNFRRYLRETRFAVT